MQEKTASVQFLGLAILAKSLTRVKYKGVNAGETKFTSPYSVLFLLSYMLKAPLGGPVTDVVVTSLGRQGNALETFSVACLGLEGSTDLLLGSRI